MRSIVTTIWPNLIWKNFLKYYDSKRKSDNYLKASWHKFLYKKGGKNE